MQGVIKAFDPDSGLGLVITDTDLTEYELADNALEGSIDRDEWHQQQPSTPKLG